MWVRQQKADAYTPTFIDISKARKISAMNGEVYAFYAEGEAAETIISFTPKAADLRVLSSEERNKQATQSFADAKLSLANLMIKWRKHRNALYLEPNGTDWFTPTHETIGAE